jgi:E3 ubiquitin-protein ligase MARCH6
VISYWDYVFVEFCPYHIGHFTLAGLQLQDNVKVQHFEGLLVTLCGYCVVGVALVILHAAASLLRWRKYVK